jgi:hypothetical protein
MKKSSRPSASFHESTRPPVSETVALPDAEAKTILSPSAAFSCAHPAANTISANADLTVKLFILFSSRLFFASVDPL